jgi:ABC-2 type transport system ATP-binding protein
MIAILNATKDYGLKRGIFDLNLDIKEGVVFGLLGPNGAGKSTTIRHLLGFSKLDQGQIKVQGIDAWHGHTSIHQSLGYLPAEIAFPSNQTGLEFIRYMADLRGIKDLTKAQRLLEYFEINPKASIKRMSKGMKQKVAIVVAFMHNPKLIILDEPTSGLDPLMSEKFIQLINEEKKLGKTILISSHMFTEIERTCDSVAIIKKGKLVTQIDMHRIHQHTEKVYELGFELPQHLETFLKKNRFPSDVVSNQLIVKIEVKDHQINDLIKQLAKTKLKYFKEQPYTLEKHFLKFYGKED